MFKFLLLLAIFPAILCFYDAEKNITVLTDSTFKSHVKGEIWAINFYSKIIPECREFAKEYIKSANALNGLIKFGAVDIDRSKTLAEKYRVNDVPHLIFVGLRNGKTLVYTGPKTVQYLVEEILDTMRGKVRENLDKGIKYTEELDGNKLEDVQLGSDKDWLVYFHAPWCTECQKIKFIWEEVGFALRKIVRCGTVDIDKFPGAATKYIAFNIPTFVYFPKHGNPVPYTGLKRSKNIIYWTLEEYQKNLNYPTSKIDDKDEL